MQMHSHVHEETPQIHCGNIFIKGTHTVYLSNSLYIINQKPMIPRIHFHCITTWVARSSG